jgi:3-oxoacyl-[acyl-carrier-protein] synthase-1
MKKNPICVISTGAVTPVGLNAAATAAAVRAGIAGFSEHPYMIDREGDPYVLAMAPLPEIMGAERCIRLAVPAIQETLAPLKDGVGLHLGDVPVIIGLPEQRPGWPQELEKRFLETVEELSCGQCALEKPVFLAKGHAAGLLALEAAVSELIKGRSAFCLAGGVDSYIDPDTLDWLEEHEQIHMPVNAWGFIPGEAAAFCLLCHETTAEKYDLPVKARLLAVSTAMEENRIKTETVCIGKGLTQAVRNCLAALPTGCRVDHTVCDQNGEAYRADEHGFMLARLSEYFTDPADYMAPADCWGDVGAASGSLFVNLTVAAAEKGYAQGAHTLLWAGSEGGQRAAALLQTGVKKPRAA